MDSNEIVSLDTVIDEWEMYYPLILAFFSRVDRLLQSKNNLLSRSHSSITPTPQRIEKVFHRLHKHRILASLTNIRPAYQYEFFICQLLDHSKIAIPVVISNYELVGVYRLFDLGVGLWLLNSLSNILSMLKQENVFRPDCFDITSFTVAAFERHLYLERSLKVISKAKWLKKPPYQIFGTSSPSHCFISRPEKIPLRSQGIINQLAVHSLIDDLKVGFTDPWHRLDDLASTYIADDWNTTNICFLYSSPNFSPETIPELICSFESDTDNNLLVINQIFFNKNSESFFSKARRKNLVRRLLTLLFFEYGTIDMGFVMSNRLKFALQTLLEFFA